MHLNDATIQQVVSELFCILEKVVNFSELTEKFFKELLNKVKVPHSLAPHTWLDKDYKKYHMAVSLLDHHLRIVRCNLPVRATPLEINQWSAVSNIPIP